MRIAIANSAPRILVKELHRSQEIKPGGAMGSMSEEEGGQGGSGWKWALA